MNSEKDYKYLVYFNHELFNCTKALVVCNSLKQARYTCKQFYTFLCNVNNKIPKFNKDLKYTPEQYEKIKFDRIEYLNKVKWPMDINDLSLFFLNNQNEVLFNENSIRCEKIKYIAD